jgi:hypothetical protein
MACVYEGVVNMTVAWVLVIVVAVVTTGATLTSFARTVRTSTRGGRVCVCVCVFLAIIQLPQVYHSSSARDPMPHSMLAGSKRALTIMVNDATQLLSLYCVDVECQTVVQTVLVPTILAVTNPTVVEDPVDPARPIIVFFHE